MTKYAILGFVLMQSMVMVGMDKQETLLKGSGDLPRAEQRSMSQELRKKCAAAIVAFECNSPCGSTRLVDLQRQYMPLDPKIENDYSMLFP